MDAEELMCSTSRSSMVVNELTGQIQLCMADGTEVLPSDKVTSREKMEIVTERLGERHRCAALLRPLSHLCPLPHPLCLTCPGKAHSVPPTSTGRCTQDRPSVRANTQITDDCDFS